MDMKLDMKLPHLDKANIALVKQYSFKLFSQNLF